MVERPPKPPDRDSSPRFKAKKKASAAPVPRTLRDLIRKDPSLEQWNEAWDEIRSGTPRAAAVLAAAFVQSAIIFALRQRFLEQPPFDIDRLLEPPGPLSSFYGCIEIGLAIGAYGPIIYNDLHTIRRIRNGFAHAMIPLTFDTPEVILELDQFRYLNLIKSQPLRPFSQYRTPTKIDFIAHGMVPSDSNRDKYTVTCELLWDQILRWGGGDMTSRAKEPYLP
jgi:hypothetical protein